MEKQPPVRKKWSERQFDLFVDTAKELGPGVSKEEFERVVNSILPPQERRGRPRGANTGNDEQKDR